MARIAWQSIGNSRADIFAITGAIKTPAATQNDGGPEQGEAQQAAQ